MTTLIGMYMGRSPLVDSTGRGALSESAPEEGEREQGNGGAGGENAKETAVSSAMFTTRSPGYVQPDVHFSLAGERPNDDSSFGGCPGRGGRELLFPSRTRSM